MSALRDLQRDALHDLVGLRERGAAARAFDFSRPPAGGVEDRWHVYAHGYVARLVEALESDYPALRRILGADAFAGLAERYVRAFPPRSYDLGRAGDLLPEHLTVDPASAGLPFLSDLARLERAVAEAFVAPDSAALGWDALLAEGAESVATLPLVPAPGFFFLASRWPVVSLWRTRLEGDADVSVPLEKNPESALVIRRGRAVVCEALGAGASAFAAAVAEGAPTLSMLEERLAPSGDAAALTSLLAVFRSFVERGVFTHPRRADAPAAAI